MYRKIIILTFVTVSARHMQRTNARDGYMPETFVDVESAHRSDNKEFAEGFERSNQRVSINNNHQNHEQIRDEYEDVNRNIHQRNSELNARNINLNAGMQRSHSNQAFRSIDIRNSGEQNKYQNSGKDNQNREHNFHQDRNTDHRNVESENFGSMFDMRRGDNPEDQGVGRYDHHQKPENEQNRRPENGEFERMHKPENSRFEQDYRPENAQFERNRPVNEPPRLDSNINNHRNLHQNQNRQEQNVHPQGTQNARRRDETSSINKQIYENNRQNHHVENKHRENEETIQGSNGNIQSNGQAFHNQNNGDQHAYNRGSNAQEDMNKNRNNNGDSQTYQLDKKENNRHTQAQEHTQTNQHTDEETKDDRPKFPQQDNTNQNGDKNNEIQPKTNEEGDKWVWGMETTTVEPVTPDLGNRAAFNGDKCPSGKVRVGNMCVETH